MITLINTETNREVKIGDVVVVKDPLAELDDRKHYLVSYITITEENIPELISKGVLKKIHKLDVSRIYEKIDRKFSEYMPSDHLGIFLTLHCIYPGSAAGIFLKEIAIELDKNYDDHISQSPRIFTISAFNGDIFEVDKSHIRNYRNFAAFRTIEDAQYARDILESYFGKIF